MDKSIKDMNADTNSGFNNFFIKAITEIQEIIRYK